MIKFFRQSYPSQYAILALMALALWLPSFVPGNAVTGLDSPVTPLFNLIDRWLGGSAIAQRIIAFVLLLADALLLNMILVDNQIVGKVGTMGAFVFILLMSLTRTQINFFPFALSIPFILLVMKEIFGVYLAQKPELDLFKAGVFTALATMCYFPSLILVPWMMVALSVSKKGGLRLQLLPITGFLFVYFLYFSHAFFKGTFLNVIKEYGEWFAELSFTIHGFNLKSVILFSFIVISAVLLYFGSGSAHFEKTIAVRTKMTISIILALFSVVLLFMGGDVLFNGLIFITLSIVLAYEFSYLGNTGWADLFLAAFMLAILANHYYFKLI